MTSVLIADDHPLVRQGLRAVLESDGLSVLGEASDGTEAVRLAAELSPDVVVMDLQMPRLHGIEATRAIVADRPDIAVLVLTMFEDDDIVFAAIAAGAAGYLLKGSDGADIVTAVRAAAAGQAVFGAGLAVRLRTWFATAPSGREPPFPQLTGRGREILDGVAAGLSNAQIGPRLFLSPKTVANNVTTILTKLQLSQLSQRAEAIVRARRRPRPHRPTLTAGRGRSA